MNQQLNEHALFIFLFCCRFIFSAFVENEYSIPIANHLFELLLIVITHLKYKTNGKKSVQCSSYFRFKMICFVTMVRLKHRRLVALSNYPDQSMSVASSCHRENQVKIIRSTFSPSCKQNLIDYSLNTLSERLSHSVPLKF